MDAPKHDLSIVVVSTNEAHWLDACLTSVYARAGSARLDVVVVDNESADGTRALVEERFPQARVVSSFNRGFAHANNRALMTCSARYALCLNPDTEIVQGTFGELVEMLDRRPDIGLLGVKQLTGDGALYPTARRFPSAMRAMAEAFTVERWPLRHASLGERELDLRKYEQELECDWVVGAFMLIRREALLGAGLMDERLFLFSDEPDLCLRVKRGGWKVVHSPAMTIVHHAGKAGINPNLVAQEVFARRVYAEKHFGRGQRAFYLGAVAARHALRAALPERRASSAQALRTLFGRQAPPFREPPLAAIDASTLAGPPPRG
jgi:GT2 family glycosyltransferase